jgi:hypothetical protein
MSTIVYLLLLTMAVSVCVSSALAWKPPQRACQSCGRETSQMNRHCRHCGALTNRF